MMKKETLPVAQGTLRGRNILVGVTGSVAAVKSPTLVRQLVQIDGANVQVLLTAGGRHFWDRAAAYVEDTTATTTTTTAATVTETGLEACGNDGPAPITHSVSELLGVQSLPVLPIVGPGWLPSSVKVHYAEDEWQAWNRMGDSVLHIALRDWADILVIAPLSAHTLAKIAHGLCDDTLSCVARAWDFGHRQSSYIANPKTNGKPIFLAPAMNTTMWEHPVTRQQLSLIQSWHTGSGVVEVPPQPKRLACGDFGVGAMAEVEAIRQMIHDVYSEMQTARTDTLSTDTKDTSSVDVAQS